MKIEELDESFDLCDLEIEGGDYNYVAEGVVVHNTNFQAGWIGKENAQEGHSPLVIASKGLGSQGLPFDLRGEENDDNLYVRASRSYDVPKKLKYAYAELGQPVFVLAEVFGIQDLKYSFNPEKDRIGFSVFDVHVGFQSDGRYLDHGELVRFCETYNLPMVPVLYEGPYSKDVVDQHTDGKEQVSGEELHIREGVVIKPTEERWTRNLGRVILKSVSEDYLTRDGKSTEYS